MACEPPSALGTKPLLGHQQILGHQITPSHSQWEIRSSEVCLVLTPDCFGKHSMQIFIDSVICKYGHCKETLVVPSILLIDVRCSSCVLSKHEMIQHLQCRPHWHCWAIDTASRVFHVTKRYNGILNRQLWLDYQAVALHSSFRRLPTWTHWQDGFRNGTTTPRWG